MKIKFKIESKAGKKTTEAKLLKFDGFNSLVSEELQNLTDDFSLEECSSIVISELDQTQLEKIKMITKEITEHTPKNIDNIAIMSESTLAVRKLKEECLDQQYRLTIYLEPLIVTQSGEITPFGNFEHLLDLTPEVPSAAQSYLDWRKQLFDLFPDLNLITQFNVEEKLAAEKAKLARYQIGMAMREKLTVAGQGFGLFNPAENTEMEKEMAEIKENVQRLKQNRSGLN
jgi:hypothetical protein